MRQTQPDLIAEHGANWWWAYDDKIAHSIYESILALNIGDMLSTVADILQPQDIDQLEKYSFSGPTDD